MANRLTDEDRLALLRIRDNLIIDHDRILDHGAEMATAMVKQADVSQVIAQAVKSLEEVLSVAGGVVFKKS